MKSINGLLNSFSRTQSDSANELKGNIDARNYDKLSEKTQTSKIELSKNKPQKLHFFHATSNLGRV